MRVRNVQTNPSEWRSWLSLSATDSNSDTLLPRRDPNLRPDTSCRNGYGRVETPQPDPLALSVTAPRASPDVQRAAGTLRLCPIRKRSQDLGIPWTLAKLTTRRSYLDGYWPNMAQQKSRSREMVRNHPADCGPQAMCGAACQATASMDFGTMPVASATSLTSSPSSAWRPVSALE